MKKHYDWKIGRPLPELKPHSLAKHAILDAYVRRYVEICTSTPVQEVLNLTIVDGFCGGGRYQMAGEEIQGSPLILLNAIADLQDRLNQERPKGFQIRTDFIFVDSNRKHTEYLREELRQSSFASEVDKSIQVWDGQFEDLADAAIAVARRRSPQRGRALFVLDQYGWSAVAFTTVQRILAKLPKAEVFLTFGVDALVDYLQANNGTESHERIGLDEGLIREILAIKDTESGWRTIIQNQLYSRLRDLTGAQFYSPFFIRSPTSHRSYWFVHLSRHREARNEIGRIHWAHHNTSLHHGSAGLNALGFIGERDARQMVLGYEFDASAKEHSRAALTKQIPNFIDARYGADSAPTLEELFGRRCNDTPVTRDMFEEVLLEMRDERELRIEDALGIDKPRARSVNWTDRIVLSRQPSFFGPFGPLRSTSA